MGAAFFRDANWLDARRAGAYLWILALINVATLGFLLATSHAGVDRNGSLLGSDFLSFWTAGHMLVAGAHPYDAAAHIAAQQQYFTAPSSYTAFFYPPPFLPVCYPLGLMPYFPALALWLTVTGTAYLAVARLWLVQAGSARRLVLLAAAFPPVLITITHGQSAFLVAALLGLGTLWVKPRPVLAGICFGLAVIKPQFGVLVPLVLLATREWRVICVAAITALAFGALATAAFGPDIWFEWLEVSKHAQAALEQGAVGFAKMMSPFAGARLIGAPVLVAYIVQGVVALAVVVSLIAVAWKRECTVALGAAMLAGAPLVTPFVLDYDLVLVAFPLISLSAVPKARPWEKLVLLSAFGGAAFARPLGTHLGVPVMPLMMAALYWASVRRAASRLSN